MAEKTQFLISVWMKPSAVVLMDAFAKQDDVNRSVFIRKILERSLKSRERKKINPTVAPDNPEPVALINPSAAIIPAE
jgi:hypothetical protein